jgi:hypothetical protein
MMIFLLGLVGILVGLCLSLEQLIIFFKRFKTKEKVVKVEGIFLNFFKKMGPWIGIAAVVIGIIDFIAPSSSLVSTPTGDINVTYRFIGDFIPALLVIISGIMVNRKILSIFNLSKEKIDQVVKVKLSKYRALIGLLTIIFSFLHWIIGKTILF